MANILFTWEMGGNLGHLAKLQALMALAQSEGHTLSVALRNLRHADTVLSGLEYRCFQAPYRQVFSPRPTAMSQSFTHTLEDFCFSGSGELFHRLRAWQEIFTATRPDIIYCESSPVALIASRNLDAARVAMGIGFMEPPADSVDGVFAPFQTTPRDAQTLARLRQDETRLLGVLNEGCTRAGLPTYTRLGDVFGAVDRNYLMTLEELDPYPWRPAASFLGVQPSFGALEPDWPTAGSRKVFCYLQDFPGLATLLAELAAADLSVLVYLRDPPRGDLRGIDKRPNLRLVSAPVDFEAAARDADFVVHHGGSLAAQSLIAGLPQLCVPTQQEQLLTALQLDRAGVGVTAPHSQKSFAREIRALLQSDRFAVRARELREKYSDWRWADVESFIRSDMETLLAGG